MRFSCISFLRDMTDDHYRKKPMSMCENQVSQILSRHPNPLNRLNTNTYHPMIKIRSHFP